MKFYSLFLILIAFIPNISLAESHCIYNYSENNYIHISRINLNCKGLELISSHVEDKGLTVSEFAKKYQTDVAINGSFFRKDLTPIGLNISYYKKWPRTQDTLARSFLACTAHNRCTIDPKNHLAKINPRWKTAIAGWHYYQQKSGQFECAFNDKIGCTQDIFTSKHPRTLIGLDENRHWLYLIVVDGRQLTYRGMTMYELATLATKLQLTQAVNLDGGGSSTMVVGVERVSNLPLFQSNERKIANHFGVRIVKGGRVK